ncbi:MAG: hypothetical protein HY314_05685 [Acidobacteria bacterium]|nr:hypothetical protein [Acidobacteriota bacterium]
MRQCITVHLPSPAHEMAQEEILKKIAHVSKHITNVRFLNQGTDLQFETPADSASDHAAHVEALVRTVQRSLRGLQRQIRFRSRAAERPVFRGTGLAPGIHLLGNGQVALQGLPLRLFRYFDRVFEAFSHAWRVRTVLTPTLIPATVLAKCDYFRSFPHSVTFATHLYEDMACIDDFRSRHQERETLDERALADMETPEACLAPAVCYHIYHMNQDQTVPATGLAYSACGKCFRYESSNMRDLRRLWDFTLREIVFLGTGEDVLRQRDRGIDMMAAFLDEHHLAGEIRTASDPFFIAPDAPAKTYFQLSAGTKYEVSLMLPDGERLAVGSLNYHTDFFGRAFNVAVEGGGPMHSACIGFGLERWVYAFLSQQGEHPENWPSAVRQAPEFANGGI